jgi:AcrR family transcriptional regulator
VETAAKLDRRARRSQRLMGDALLALTLEKGYETVTIKDITERADVAYVTFFRHFDSKADLLNRRLAEELQDLRARIEAAAQAGQAEQREVLAGRLIFEHVQEKQDLYRVLLSTQGALQVRKHVQATIAAIFLDSCRPLHESRLVPAEAAANHMAAALLALIEWWLDADLAQTTEHMAQIYERLVVASTLSAVLS